MGYEAVPEIEIAAPPIKDGVKTPPNFSVQTLLYMLFKT